VKGVAKTINQQGGIGGRKVVVDFYDSKLNPNESRNAIIKACQNDFAVIGSATLFLTSVDDQVNCADQAGEAVGLPEVGGIVTGVLHQCNDVSFPAQPPQLLCDTAEQHPQTYQGQQGPTKWLLKNVDKDLHGAAVLPNDTKDAYRGIKVQVDVCPPGLFAAVGHDLCALVAEGLARAPELTAEGVREGLELVKLVPSAEGRAGTTLGFGHWDRGALHGQYLVVRQWRDAVPIEVDRR
jgi:hypothetical protein